MVLNSSNQLVIGGLDGGEYRATITDSGGAGCNEVVKSFTIMDTDLEIVEENLVIPSCDNIEGFYTFKLNNVHKKYKLSRTTLIYHIKYSAIET